MSRQTLTHCGMYLDQNQEADFHLGLVQSAKGRCEKEKKRKRDKSRLKKKKKNLYCIHKYNSMKNISLG